MKVSKAKTKEDQKPISILKKSESYKAIRTQSLFDNEQLKQLKPKQSQISNNVGSVHSSFQQTLKDQLRRLRKKQNGDNITNEDNKKIIEKRKSLGHQLIQQIKSLSNDETVLTRTVVQFMQSVSSTTNKDMVQHFKNMVGLISKAIKTNLNEKVSQKDKQILSKKNSLKKMLINSKSLEDEYEDTNRQLKLYKTLLEEQKSKNKQYELKLSKMKKTNYQLQDKLQTLQIKYQQMKKMNKKYQIELDMKEQDIQKLRKEIELEKQKHHCLKIENQSLYEKNKQIEREVFSMKKQGNTVKSKYQVQIEELNKQIKSLNIINQQLQSKYDQLLISQTNLKNQSQKIKKLAIQKTYLLEKITEVENKLQEATINLRQAGNKCQAYRKREIQLQSRLEVLEQQKSKLNLELKSIFESHQSKEHNSYPEQILPPPSPYFQRQPINPEKQPKNNKKLKALEDIQALIRKHKAEQ